MTYTDIELFIEFLASDKKYDYANEYIRELYNALVDFTINEHLEEIIVKSDLYKLANNHSSSLVMKEAVDELSSNIYSLIIDAQKYRGD